MKAGDIVFVQGESWVSDAIRFFDNGTFTHVGIAVSDTHIVEAQRFTRVRIAPLPAATCVALTVARNERERMRIVLEATNMIGMRYDYLQILGYVFRKLFADAWGGSLNSPSRLICSEMVSRALFKAGITEDIDQAFDLTPNELYAYLTYEMEERGLT